MATPAEILALAGERMKHSLEAFSRELVHLRAGRATSGLVDHIRVDAYGTQVPLGQMATISTPDAQTILISPFDKSQTHAVEKAINLSSLSLMANVDGSLIRIRVPPLTEERRRELAKAVSKLGEDARVALRNIRRDSNEQIKKLEKGKDVSEDEMHHYLEQVDKLLERQLAEVDQHVAAKQKEITEF